MNNANTNAPFSNLTGTGSQEPDFQREQDSQKATTIANSAGAFMSDVGVGADEGESDDVGTSPDLDLRENDEGYTSESVVYSDQRMSQLEERVSDRLAEDRRADTAEEASDSFWSDSFKTSNQTVATVNRVHGDMIEDDPDWEQTEEEAKEMLGDIYYEQGMSEERQNEVMDLYYDSSSKEEAQYRVKNWKAEREANRRLGSQGVIKRTGGIITAGVADPQMWAETAALSVGASAVGGPVGAAAATTLKLGKRAKKIASTALRVGNVAASAAATEELLQRTKYYRDENAVAYAAVTGGLLASAGPAFRGVVGGTSAAKNGIKNFRDRGNKDYSDRMSSQAHNQEARQNGEQAGNTTNRPYDQEAAQDNPADSMDVGPDDAGAARVSRRENIDEDAPEIEAFEDAFQRHGENIAPRTAFKGARFDSVATLKGSDNPVNRALGNVTAFDGVGNQNKAIPLKYTATETRNDVEKAAKGAYHARRQSNLAKERRRLERKIPDSEFDEQVTSAARGVKGDYSPAVKDQAEMYMNTVTELRKDMANPGRRHGEVWRPVKGYEDFNPKDPAQNAFPRYHDGRARSALEDEIGTDNLHRLITGAFKRGGVQADKAGESAGAYLKAIRAADSDATSTSTKSESANMMNGSPEAVRSKLESSTAMSDNEIDEIVDVLTVKEKTDTNGPDPANPNTSAGVAKLDDSFSMVLRRNPETGTGSREVSVNELFEQDSVRSMDRFTQEAASNIAQARIHIPGFVNGITSEADWQRAFKTSRLYASVKGLPAKKNNKELEQLEFLKRQLQSKSLYDETSGLNQNLRRLRDVSYMNSLGTSGWAQFSEFGNAIGAVGMENLFNKKTMSAALSVRNKARDGTLSNDVAAEMEAATGLATEWISGSKYTRRQDGFDANVDMDINQSGVLDKADKGLHYGTRAVSLGSGNVPFTVFQQRAAAAGSQNRWGKRILKNHENGERELPWSKERLASQGMSEEKAYKIMDEIEKHATRDENGNVQRMNFEKWDSKDNAATFQEGTMRVINRAIQQNDPGTMRAFMSAPLYRSLMQFRSFQTQAYTTQLLHGIHHRDAQTASQFLGSMFTASMGYVARTHTQAIGRSDRKEFIEDRLSWDEIGKAAFQWSSFATLMPDAIDTASYFTPGAPEEGVFNNGYRNRVDTNSLISNPSLDTIDGVLQGLHTMKQGETDIEEYRSVRGTIPFQNMVGVQQLLNVVFQEGSD